MVTRTAPVRSAADSRAAATGGQSVAHRWYWGLTALYSAAAPCAAAATAAASAASTCRCSMPSADRPPVRDSTRTSWPRADSRSAVVAPTGPLPTITCSAMTAPCVSGALECGHCSPHGAALSRAVLAVAFTALVGHHGDVPTTA